jgi:hypothetical protein
MLEIVIAGGATNQENACYLSLHECKIWKKFEKWFEQQADHLLLLLEYQQQCCSKFGVQVENTSNAPRKTISKPKQ